MSVRPIHDYYQPGVSSTHAYHSYERWNPPASAAGPMPSASDGRHAATSSQKQPKSSQSQEPPSAGMHHRSSSSRPDPSSASYHHHHPTSSSNNNNDPRLERGRRTEGRSAPSSSAPRPSAAPLASSSAYPPQTPHSSRAVNKHEERGTGHKRTAAEPAIYDAYGTSRRAVSASRAADASYMVPPISVRTDQQATQPSSSSRARSTDAERQKEEERARRHERREEKERQRQRQRETQGMTALEQDRENERQREIEKAKERERESRRARERSRANEMEMATEKSRRTEARDVTNTHSTRQREPIDERMRPVEPPARAADTDRSTHRARTREGYPDQQPSTKPMKAFRDYGDLTAQDPDSSDSARRYPVSSTSRHHRRHTEEALINAIAQSYTDGRGDAPPRPAPKPRHSDQMPSTRRSERQAPDPKIPSTSQHLGATSYHSSRTKPTPPEKSHRDRAIASDSTHGMSSGSDTERRHRRDNNHRMPSAQEPRRAHPGSRSVPQDPLDPSTAESYNRPLAQPSHELRHTSTNRPIPSKADAAHLGSSLPPAQKPNDYATMRPPDAQASAEAMRDRMPLQPAQPPSRPQPSSRDRPEKPSRRMSTVFPPVVYPPKKDDEYAKVKTSTLKIRTADVPTATATAIPPSSSSRPMNITSMPERSSPEPMYSNLSQYPSNAKATSTSITAAPPSSARPTPLTQTRSSDGPKPSPVRPSPAETLAALLEINVPPNLSPANQSRNRSSRDKESPVTNTTAAAEANNVSVAAIKSARKVSFQDNDGYEPKSRAHPLDGNNGSNKPSPPVISADPKSSSGRAYPLDNRPSPPAISAEPKSSSRAYPADNRPSPPAVNGEPKSSGRTYPLDSRLSPPAISAEPKTSSGSRAHPLDGKPSPLTSSTAPAPPMAPPISALPPQFSTSSGSATVVNDSPYRLTPIGKNDSPPRIVQIKAEDSPNSRPGNRKRKTGEEAQVRERRPEPVAAVVPEPSRQIEQPPPMSASASRSPQYARDSPPPRPSAAAAAGPSYQSKADTNSTSPLLPHVPPPFLVPPMSAAPSTQSQSHSQQQPPFVIHGLGKSILDTPSPPPRHVLLRGDTKEHRESADEPYTPTPPVNSGAATVDRPYAQKAKLSPNYATSFDVDPAAYGSSNNKHRDEYAKPKQSPPFSRYDGPTMSTEKLDLDLTPTLATAPGLGMGAAQAPTTPYLSSIDPRPSGSSNNYNNGSSNDGRRQQASDRRSFMAPTVPPYGAPPLEVSNRYPHNIVTVDVDARKPASRQMPPPPPNVNDDRFQLPPNSREREREREVVEDRKASLEMPSSLANLYQAPLSQETAPMLDGVGSQASNGRYAKYADHSPLENNNNNVVSSRLAKDAPQAVHPSVLSQVYRSYAHGTVPPRSMPRPASRNETYATFTPTARNDSKEQLTPTRGEVALDQLSRPRAPPQSSPGYQQQQQQQQPSMQAVPPQMSRLTSDTAQKQQQQPPLMSSSRPPMPPQPKNSNSSTETIQTAERSRPKPARPSGSGPLENGPQPTSRRPAQTETSAPSTMPMMVSERSISNDSGLLKTPSSLAPTPRLSPREHPVLDPIPVPSSQPSRGANTSSSSKKSGGLFSMLRSKSSTPKSRAEPEYARRPGTGAAPNGKLTSQSDSSLALPTPPNKSSAAASRTMAIATQTPVAVPSQSHYQPYQQQTSQSYHQSSQPPPPSSRLAPESRPSKPKSKTLPPITIPTQGPQHPGSKVFNAFRNLGTKRHRTMSTLSIDAQASTANTTVIASPTVSSVSQAPVYPWRDPQEATSAWQKQGEKDMIKSGKERRYRPGVTFELEDDRREGSRAPMAPAATPYISSRDHYSRPVPVTNSRR